MKYNNVGGPYCVMQEDVCLDSQFSAAFYSYETQKLAQIFVLFSGVKQQMQYIYAHHSSYKGSQSSYAGGCW